MRRAERSWAYGKRRLHVTVSGRWYLILTIGLGVVALMTGNNVLYLLESFLLGGLILSGVLSEQAIAAIDLRVRRRASIAKKKSFDRIEIENRSRLALYSVEIGEWRFGRFERLALLPHIEPRGRVILEVPRVFERRGIHAWQGLACATAYPFGLARKVRFVPDSGERVVWPEDLGSTTQASSQASSSKTQGAEGYSSPSVNRRLTLGEAADGEVRSYQTGDDLRDAIWSLSLVRDEPLLRARAMDKSRRSEILDLRQDRLTSESLEKRLAELATLVYRDELQALTVLSQDSRKRFESPSKILDLLALTEKPE
jgi:uncharacterized protein (DUF58 family)